jgi:NAD(P)H dehydrogenase (quinone)
MSPPITEIRILIVYYSRYGVLKLLAERAAEGARRIPGVEVRCLEVGDQPVEELRPGETKEELARRRAATVNQLSWTDALIVGAPAYFGSMASPVKRLFEDCATANPPPADRSRPWRHHLFRDRIGAAFTASGTPHGGNEQALHSILTMLMHLGMIVVTPGQGEPILENPAAPYGATAVAGPAGNRIPDEAEQEAARALGERTARVTSWLVWGRTEWEKRREQHRLPEAGVTFEPW